jgi:ATP-binding cassette subfamily B (MDR/TAP) protein 1
LQKLWFGLGGDNLSFKLRMELFKAILRKHVGWFDNKSRAPGIIVNILLDDIAQINGLTTESTGIVLESALGLFASIFICAIFTWQLAIVVTVLSPLIVLGGYGMAST